VKSPGVLKKDLMVRECALYEREGKTIKKKANISDNNISLPPLRALTVVTSPITTTPYYFSSF
jgi:hypothetical protein